MATFFRISLGLFALAGVGGCNKSSTSAPASKPACTEVLDGKVFSSAKKGVALRNALAFDAGQVTYQNGDALNRAAAYACVGADITWEEGGAHYSAKIQSEKSIRFFEQDLTVESP